MSTVSELPEQKWEPGEIKKKNLPKVKRKFLTLGIIPTLRERKSTVDHVFLW